MLILDKKRKPKFARDLSLMSKKKKTDRNIRGRFLIFLKKIHQTIQLQTNSFKA